MEIHPIVKEILGATIKSANNLKDSIVDVRAAGFNADYTVERISFEIKEAPGFKKEIAGKYIGELRGKNKDFCIGFGMEGDKSIAFRVFLAGNAEKVVE